MDPSYNNNFNGANPGGMTPGGFPENNMPISSGTGDIVLSSGNNKKPKAWLVVLWMVAMIAIIIAVWFFVFNPMSSQSGLFSNTQLPASQAFARYVNYYLYGNTDIESDIATIEEYSQSFFSKQVNSEDNSRVEYFTNLRNYFEELLNTYGQDSNADSDAINVLSDYGKKLRLVTFYYSGASIDRALVLESYTKNGLQAVSELAKANLSPYENLGLIYGISYYDLATQYTNVEGNLISVYDGFGCIANNDIDYMCTSQKANGESTRLNDELSDIYSDMRAVLINSQADLFGDIPTIKKLLEEIEDNNSQEGENA